MRGRGQSTVFWTVRIQNALITSGTGRKKKKTPLAPGEKQQRVFDPWKLILATYSVSPLRLRSKKKMTTILLCWLTDIDIVNIIIPVKDRNGLNYFPNPGASLTNQARRKEGETGVGRKKGCCWFPSRLSLERNTSTNFKCDVF